MPHVEKVIPMGRNIQYVGAMLIHQPEALVDRTVLVQEGSIGIVRKERR